MRLILFYNVALQLAAESGKTIGEAFDMIRRIGYTGIDPLVWGETGDDVKALRTLAEDHGLDIPACSCMAPLYSDADYDICRRFVEAAAEMGAKSAMLLPSPIPEGKERDDLRAILASYLSPLCLFARERGVTLSVENFSRLPCPFSTISDFEYLLTQVPELMMTLDTGNFVWVGESPSEAADRITALRRQPFSHVHMKNYSRTRYNDNRSPAGRDLSGGIFYSYPCVGGGMADLGHICDKLKEIGYDGCVSVENGGIVPAEPALSDSASWLKENLGI